MNLSNTLQIEAILDRAREEIERFGREREACVGAASTPLPLAVTAMIVTVLARSALDYIAADIHDQLAEKTDDFKRCGNTPYFPIYTDAGEFDKRMGRKHFPGISKQFPALAAYLRSIQPFSHACYAGLAELHAASGQVKHQGLKVVTVHPEQIRNVKQATLDQLREEDPAAYHKCFAYWHHYFKDDENRKRAATDVMQGFVDDTQNCFWRVNEDSWV